jgi:hypothetical protein
VAAADIAGTNTLTNGPLLLLTFDTLAWPSEPLNIQLGNPGAVYQAKDAEAPLVYQLLGDDGDLRPEYAPIFDNLATIPIGAKDTDQDRIPDFAEALFPTASETNVYIADSDGDGVLDADEIDLNLSPRTRDTDGDGLWDGYELWLGTDPINVMNQVTDADNDGLPEAVNDDLGSPLDLAALLGGADPDGGNVDTDGDGFADGYDAMAFLTAAAASDDTLVPNLGDVNDMGGINPTDALICLSLFIQNITLEHPAIVNDQAFDVNRDGQINPTDALIMLRRFGGFSNAAVLPVPIN